MVLRVAKHLVERLANVVEGAEVVWAKVCRERKRMFTLQPPIGENDDYDIENSWIAGALPSRGQRREGLGKRDERPAQNGT